MSIQKYQDPDSVETREWTESIEAVLRDRGPDRARFLMGVLRDWMHGRGHGVPFNANTPYVNTIPVDKQVPYPGDRVIARRIKSYVRWNAMAMVVRANRRSPGIGGHISTYASAATLLEVGFNHFFRANTPERTGDQIYFQGHCAPGIYARAYVERRIDAPLLHNFRRELQDLGGLPSYPHPWLLPDFWEFPTVSMGLGPISAIYQARFNRYLHDRGLADTDATSRARSDVSNRGVRTARRTSPTVSPRKTAFVAPTTGGCTTRPAPVSSNPPNPPTNDLKKRSA